MDEWLGVEYGEDTDIIKLPDRLKAALKAGFAKDVWTEEEVPQDDVKLDEVAFAERVDFFADVIDDCHKVTKTDSLKSDKKRFARWLKCGYAEEDDVYQQGVASSKKLIITDEFRKDMDTQGMTEPSMLFGLELCVYLGRACALPELEGGAHGQPPSSMKGAINAAKVGKRLGVSKTLDDHLADARKSGDREPVIRHFNETCHRLSNSSNLPYNDKGANRIQTFVNKSKMNVRDPLAWIIYHIECRIKYMGRGYPMPDLFDVELGMSAKEQAEELRAQGLAPGQGGVLTLGGLKAPSQASTLVLGSESGSSVGPSASQASGFSFSQVSQALTAIAGLNTAVSVIMDRLDRVESGVKIDGDATEGRKCWFCPSTTHTSDSCPTDKAKKYRENKAKKEAEAAAKG